MFDYIDIKKDGYIDYSEWLYCFQQLEVKLFYLFFGDLSILIKFPFYFIRIFKKNYKCKKLINSLMILITKRFNNNLINKI